MKTQRSTHYHSRRTRRQQWTFWIFGLGSLLWLLLRSGTRPRRLAYPCQRAALASGSGFLAYLASLLGATYLYHGLKRQATPLRFGLCVLALLLTASLTGSDGPASPVYAQLTLPAWTSPTAVSNVFVAPNVPAPECSLAGGALPGAAPCDDPAYALRDAGVDSLVDAMERQGDYFFQTGSHPGGVVGTDDVVVIKINNQWAGMGDGDGRGRLSTNTDVLKGLIWRILQHPDGFSGEVVVAENTQDSGAQWDTTPANAQDQDQAYPDVVRAFQSLGYPVSLFRWDDLNYNLVSGGAVAESDYPAGEYATGNSSDVYVLLEDPDASGVDELSYPKFQTAGGNNVSMRYGVWDGSSYDAERLTFINLPVLKKHGMAGATIAWKNLIGWVTIFDTERRYGNWDAMHGFYWGYTEDEAGYGLIGRQLALVRAPDLNIVDAIWVAVEDNTSGNASRQDVLLASRDPFAVDWYSSEYVLQPIAAWGESSAARGGMFRNATRVNQNAAQAVWPGGDYPYMDLLDDYDGDSPSEAEKSQLNVYVSGVAAAPIAAEQPTPPPDTPEAAEPPPVEPPPPADAAQPPAGIMADFDADIENWSFYADEPSTVQCGPDSSVTHSGASSLRMDYAIVPENWVDCARYFDQPQDWSGSPGISLWLRSSAAAQEILFIVFVGDADNPTPFEVYFDTTAESVQGWTQFAFAWTDFEMADWADASSAAELPPAEVQSIVFSPMSAETQVEGALWLDDLALVSGEAPPPPPKAVAPTEEPPPAAPTEEPAATEPPPPTEKPDEEKESGGGGGLCGGTILPLGMAAVVLARKRR